MNFFLQNLLSVFGIISILFSVLRALSGNMAKNNLSYICLRAHPFKRTKISLSLPCRVDYET